jgi:hypothetical protein
MSKSVKPKSDAEALKFLEELSALRRPSNTLDNADIFPHPTPIEEIGCKAAARILLSRIGTTRIVVPDRNEWLGVALLERDDELPKRRQ